MKNIYKILLAILIIGILSVGAYFIFKMLGITNIETLRQIIESCGIWGWFVFLILQIIVTNFLCFIPGTSAIFIAVGIALFGSIKAFLICSLSVFLSSSLMFLIGNSLGERAVIKLVGKDSLEKAQDLIDVKSKIFLPIMFLFPIFPDDALCCVAGMTKMKYWYFATIVVIFRSIGIATICFLGSNFFLNMFFELNYIEMFMLINLFIIDIYAIIKVALGLENKIKENKNDN